MQYPNIINRLPIYGGRSVAVVAYRKLERSEIIELIASACRDKRFCRALARLKRGESITFETTIGYKSK